MENLDGRTVWIEMFVCAVCSAWGPAGGDCAAGMLSPPVFSGTLAGDSDVYHPVYLVPYLPGVELMIDRKEFSEAGVEMILGRVRVA